jgi:hypothetical protein
MKATMRAFINDSSKGDAGGPTGMFFLGSQFNITFGQIDRATASKNMLK